MDKLLRMYRKLSADGVRLFSWDIGGEKATTMEMNGEYAIFVDFDNIENTAEETAVVFHEGGHVNTGATHKVSSPYDLVEKHEYKAWKWAVQNFVSAEELDEAVAAGYTDIPSLAEHFGVTEQFMKKAVCYYTHGNVSAELYF